VQLITERQREKNDVCINAYNPALDRSNESESKTFDHRLYRHRSKLQLILPEGFPSNCLQSTN
jgi:hypothetical protein